MESLTANQQQFVADAESCGLEVDYTYSGRGMFGKQCPAVRVDSPRSIETEARTEIDSMGHGWVIYASR